jgi:DNA-binding NtrC family response regulator
MPEKDKDKVTILIADDESEMRNLLASIVRTCGYSRIVVAGDGATAMDIIAQPNAAIALAFLDINMPGMTGIEVLLEAKKKRPQCAYVMVSGMSAVDNVMTALKAGAIGFIVKPYTTKKIFDILSKFEREAAQ